ncbi:shikimate dehydrogenase family protein [Pelagerythrobacter marinus]|uniref:shikimate dehydrogenase family protein n=1 Tax=Pelagerythrobacter marinus TaxID=538382 RepID=UPI0020371FB8|nr:shikimate dehydrogenase [Pelagerythrobacter marinus]USA39183.1 shikimate dehydrogenase [Pelagerythrobacter marinus]WPZ06730.1 shikimate dehydrogenase [Pelagerythrobacter marinus]
MTRLIAEVIGDPIGHSKSPAIHGFWIAELGLEADYRAHRVTAEGLGDYLARRRAEPQWRGCNVTMPHKQAIIPLLDRIDPFAARVGAVNTVVREGEELVGYNTDVAGFLEPLGPVLERRHLFRMARVLGTGGAARAVVAGLVDHGFTLVVAGRNPDKARALLDRFDPEGEHHVAELRHFAAPTAFRFDDRAHCCDLVINASPLGMRGQPPLAFDWSHAPPGSIAYDIVTDPVETGFLADARAAGFDTIDGLAMLIGQAREAFARFFGRQPPRERDAALRERIAP